MPYPTTYHLRSLALLVTALLLAAALPSVVAYGGDDAHVSGDLRLASQIANDSLEDHPDHDRRGGDDRLHDLGVRVTARTDDGRAPAGGAKVLVYEVQRNHNDDRHRGPHTTDGIQAEPAARGVTNDRGVVTFELAPGHYGLRIHHEAGHGHKLLKLDEDRRVHVHVGGDDRPRDAGPFNLGIAAYKRTDDGPQSAANASVEIYRYVRGATEANASWKLMETGTTDERGQYTTTLPKGLYLVKVTDGDLEDAKRIPLNHDRWTRMLLQENGHEGETTSVTTSGPTVHPLPPHAKARLEVWHALWIKMKG